MSIVELFCNKLETTRIISKAESLAKKYLKINCIHIDTLDFIVIPVAERGNIRIGLHNDEWCVISSPYHELVNRDNSVILDHLTLMSNRA